MKRVLVSAMVLGILGASMAGAQHMRVSVGAGAMLPNGAYWTRPVGFGYSVDDVGWHLLGAVEVSVPRSPLRLRVDGIHVEIGGGNAFYSNVHYKLNGGIASLVYHIVTPVVPIRFYLLAGAGYVGSRSETNPAFAGGTGVTFGTGSTKVFVEGRFVRFRFSGSPMNFIPLTAGVSFGP